MLQELSVLIMFVILFINKTYTYNKSLCLHILEGEDQLTKRQYLHTTANTTITVTFTCSITIVTVAPTTSIATTCKVK